MNADANTQADHPQTLDRLHRGIVVELTRQERRDTEQDRFAAGRQSATEAQIRSDVDRAMQAIKTAGSSIGALSEKSRACEDTIRDLKKIIVDLKQSQEAADQRAAKAETRIRQETDRAQNAEARVRACETQIKQMEHREKTIMGNLDRVMRMVDATFGSTERTGEPSKVRPRLDASAIAGFAF